MASDAYAAKLRDPRWQKRRLEIFERDGWKCMGCYARDRTLHVHHRYYVGDPWDAPDDALETLCDECHALESMRGAQETELLQAVGILNARWINILAEAFRCLPSGSHPPRTVVACVALWLTEPARVDQFVAMTLEAHRALYPGAEPEP